MQTSRDKNSVQGKNLQETWVEVLEAAVGWVCKWCVYLWGTTIDKAEN